MDPLSILSGVAQTGKVAWELGVVLHDLVKSTRVVNETVKNLAAEVTQLSNVCEAVRGQLAVLVEQHHAQPAPESELERREDARLGDGINAQLSQCDRAMVKLNSAISGVRQNRSNFILQTVG